MHEKATRYFLWIMAAFYAAGALVHANNLLGAIGAPTPSSPLKWQVLDVLYLCLDLAVVYGAVRSRPWTLACLGAAAILQSLLYTVLRRWLLDVPEAVVPAAPAVAHLDGLVAFHALTLVAIAVLLAWGSAARRRGN